MRKEIPTIPGGGAVHPMRRAETSIYDLLADSDVPGAPIRTQGRDQ